MSLPTTAEPPWYRQGWPWFIIAFPATSVVLGITLLVLAIRSDDGLVVDDYYTEGKTINRRIERDQQARRLGIAARVRSLPAGLSLELTASATDFAPPTRLTLDWIHVTDASKDGGATLHRVGGGRYVAADTILPSGGRWRLHLTPAGAHGEVDSVPGTSTVGPVGEASWRLVSDALVLTADSAPTLDTAAVRELDATPQ